jgi:hypothetical protein
MSGRLPMRYDDVLDRKGEELRETLREAVQGTANGAQRVGAAFAIPEGGMKRVGVAAAAVFVAYALITALLPRSASGRSTVPFDKSVSVQTLGGGFTIQDLIPPSATPPPPQPKDPVLALAESDPALKAAAATPPPPRPARPPEPFVPTPKPKCEKCELEKAARARAEQEARGGSVSQGPAGGDGFGVVLYSEDPGEGLDIPAAQAPHSILLNIGTRFVANLAFKVRTGAAPAPVTATVKTDVMAGPDLAVRAGATLVGQAIAVRDTERVQILFTSLVQDGRTMPIMGIALGPDDQLGLPGKVIRRASGGKSLGGRVLGGIARIGTFGLVGGGAAGLTGAAESALVGDVAQELSGLEQKWARERSDAVIESPARAPVIVYLEGDLKLQ